MNALPTHRISLALGRPLAEQLDAGTDIVLTIKASCSHGCDLRGRVVNILTHDGVIVAESTLAEHADRVNETKEFAVRAPEDVGDHLWNLVLLRYETESVIHEQESLAIGITTRAHDTSLAVWGVPSPVVIGHPMRIHVGATCSSGCGLSGREIEVCDDTGACVARGRLGDVPWEGTRALFWTEVDLLAPATVGSISQSVRFAATGLRLPHDGALARFGFEAVERPRHMVTIRVIEKESGTPIENAQVRLGVYFAYSDETGAARIATPRGTYDLDVLKTGYETRSRVLDVNDDITVDAEAEAVPPEDPEAYWQFDPSKRT